MPRRKTSRYMKISSRSDGYKQGYRYIDFGAKKASRRFLKHKPRLLRKRK